MYYEIYPSLEGNTKEFNVDIPLLGMIYCIVLHFICCYVFQFITSFWTAKYFIVSCSVHIGIVVCLLCLTGQELPGKNGEWRRRRRRRRRWDRRRKKRGWEYHLDHSVYQFELCQALEFWENVLNLSICCSNVYIEIIYESCGSYDDNDG